MSKPDLEQVSREGPLPKVDDDSELVGKDDTSGVAKEHGADFVTIPARGAGAFPVSVPDSAEEQDADADPEQRER